jgi:acetyl-CoA/propionyl-CoA carboxylase, biotin carboxylase, biotin carboxyl carrier protein
MFSKVLIANRGEIAVRVINACRELGIKTVAIYSEPDKHGRHVSLADEAIQLDGQPGKVYLDIPQIVELAKKSGAQAVHPGYGFLSENGDFAEAVLAAGMKFVGPKPDVIRSMGSKVEARRAMEKAGVPVVPGTTDPVTTPEQVKALATKYGYPVAIKASAGGGGRGLKVVRKEEEVDNALASAQREGASYFGSSEVYIEKYLDHPHHIEVQILGDETGTVVQLGERDCSSQRRHQKLVEETPGPILKDSVRQKLLASAVKGAAALGYTSAGTLEYLVSGDEFYFLEVNTRVQVEHPITEMVTGIDIVKEQICIAAGEPLSFKQEDVKPRGHSIEFRINAEDPYKNFMPSPGTVVGYSEPRLAWVRVDSACYEGYQILPFYDSLLAKLVIWGKDRAEAIARSQVALRDYRIEGVSTTIPFHLAILQDSRFIEGEVDTKYVEAEFMPRFIQERKLLIESGALKAPANNISVAPPSAGAALHGAVSHAGVGAGSGTGAGAGAKTEKLAQRLFEVEVNQKQFKIAVAEVVSEDSARLAGVAGGAKRGGAGSGAGASGGSSGGRNGRARSGSAVESSTSGKVNDAGDVCAAMHGLIKEVYVKEGDQVAVGTKLLILEAMKMESEVMSDRAGKVTNLSAKVGDTVESGSCFMTIVAQ